VNWLSTLSPNLVSTETAYTQFWIIPEIPLVVNQTNIIIVTAATTSWAPAYGGSTTFSDTLTVVCNPIQVTLRRQGTHALLNWTGGSPPYRIQWATNFAISGWTDFLSSATPPVTLPITGQASFYRVAGQ